MKGFQNPSVLSNISPDIVYERVGEYRYECYCDQSLAKGTSPLEEQDIWLILRLQITELNGETCITKMHPEGSRQYRFSPKKRAQYQYRYAQ
ncbi:MAG: hypothetical protein PHI42_06195 [Paludibacteraceae bacterium]|nr:hypothetical protein [Paludibacteraceae bacterium]